ncbi:MAG: lactate racemase domain-containing protein [Pirellulaceae bacterium]
MQYKLRYGRGLLNVDVPDDVQVTCLRKPPMPPLSDERAAVLDALARPVDSPDLAQLARGARSACIAICDITRPVPNQLFLRPMIETMLAAGMPASKITVLVATGLHRPNEGAELEELLGDPWVQQTVAVENHFARDDAQHVNLGTTSTRARWCASTAASSRPICASPPGWLSPILWRAIRRPQGDRSRAGTCGNDHHLSQFAIHGRSLRHQLQLCWQSAT